MIGVLREPDPVIHCRLRKGQNLSHSLCHRPPVPPSLTMQGMVVQLQVWRCAPEENRIALLGLDLDAYPITARPPVRDGAVGI